MNQTNDHGQMKSKASKWIHHLSYTYRRRLKPTVSGPSHARRGDNVPGLTLRLEEGKDVVLTHGTLDVTDDRTGSVVHELDADLGHTTAGAGTAEHL